MHLSKFFLPQLREFPNEAEIISHKIMLRSGMVKQAGAGIYNWLPLGLRVLKKIEKIVRQEQNKASCVEMLMPTIQQASLWKESGRYDDYGKEMLRIKDRKDREMLFGPTNEEQLTSIIKNTVHSYRQLPLLLYHIQWKFRDEIRPRFGVMRGREFLMKDSYSFDVSQESAKISYLKMFSAYLSTFARLGLKAIPVKADPGPIGGDLSHEFIILAKTGESEVHLDKRILDLSHEQMTAEKYNNIETLNKNFDCYTNYYASADEKFDQKLFAETVEKSNQITMRGIEVGHIFYFATKYSQAMEALVQGKDGKNIPMHMGSYGIGISRLVGAIIEAHHKDNAPLWPFAVAPFTLAIINLKVSDQSCNDLCKELIDFADKNNIDFLYDDTNTSAGEKFSRMKLIGCPIEVTVGPKFAKNGQVELKFSHLEGKTIDNLPTILKMIAKMIGDNK